MAKIEIDGKGWELLVERLGMHRDGSRRRTYGTYQVFVDGAPRAGLAGFLCETVGPGDNDREGNKRRVREGRYPISTQFGRYRSIGYATDEVPGAEPMPALLLTHTAKRTGILIHPGHPPNLYISSVGCLNPTNPLTPGQTMDFFESRKRVVALIDDLRSFAPAAFDLEVATRIRNAQVVIRGEPTAEIRSATARTAAAGRAASAEPDSMPISKAAAVRCGRWMTDNFAEPMRVATRGKAYDVALLCGIVCQETAFKWLRWTDALEVQTIVERCVFDASGDDPGSPRDAFPKNTAAFRQVYGDALTDMLIEEANATRRIQGWKDKRWVYKGYGLFQYDLQHIRSDSAFFEGKKWYRFDECLKRVCAELDAKLVDSRGDLWDAVRRYNGRGRRAEAYAKNVKFYTECCRSAGA